MPDHHIINVGERPDDGTGDFPRLAFTKINENFAQVFAYYEELEQAINGRAAQNHQHTAGQIQDLAQAVEQQASGLISGAIATHNQNPSAHPGLTGGGGGIVVPFFWGDASPKPIFTVQGTVVRASLLIQQPFNIPSSLRLGDAGNPARIMSTTQNLPTETGLYSVSPGHLYAVSTPVFLTISLGVGNTQGSGLVILEVV